MLADKRMKKLTAVILGSASLMFLSVLIVLAQDPGMLKEMFARNQQQNTEALKQYAWKSKNEVRKNGESKSTQVFLNHHDAAGNLQKSQIGGSAPPAMPKGPLLANIAKRKKEEMVVLINGVGAQVKLYSHLPPEKMKAFMAGAKIGPNREEGGLQIHGGNILQPGDSMTILLDPQTRKQRRVVIHTYYEQYPVEAVIEFNSLPAGPTYMARTIVDYPKEALQLITENFDYERETR